MSRPAVSVLFPTRSRGALARATLASACANAPEDVEVIVADNDDPGAPPLRPPDGRTVVLPRPASPLPMSDNWERALARARGEWVLVLSDKYHLVAGALAELLRRASPDLEVIQYGVGYFQQSIDDPRPLDPAALVRAPGCMLPVRRGEEARRSTTPFLDGYRTEPTYQGTAPMLYNALVRRSVIERVRGRTGRFFVGAAPDVSSAIQLSATVQEFLRLERPAVLAHHPSKDGSRWSTGVAVLRSAARARAFVRESAPGSALLAELPPLGISIMLETVLETLRARGLLDEGTERRLWRRYVELALEEATTRGLEAGPDLAHVSRTARRRIGLRSLLGAGATAARRVARGAARTTYRSLLLPDAAPLEAVPSLEVALRRAQEAWTVADPPAPRRISIIIPTYERPGATLDALRSLSSCEPPPHEVIVVDQSARPLAGAPSTGPGGCPVRVVRHGPPNAQTARNLGARLARGDVLLYLDDDVLVDPGLVGAHAAAYADPTVGAVGGFFTEPGEAPVDVVPERVGRGATGWIHFPHAFTGRVETGLLPTCNGSIRRELLFRAGGFDENFIRTHLDDTDLSARLRAMGVRIIHEPRARLVHLKTPSGGNRPRPLDDTVLADRYAWQVWVYFYWLNFGVRGLPDLGRRLRGCVVRRPNLVRPWRLARGLAEAGVGTLLAVRAMRGGRKLPLRPEDPCTPSS